MTTTAEKPRFTGRVVAYDALRVFAILSVVAIHTLMPYRSVLPPDAPVRVLDDLLHYAVPLFVFISGALLWSKPWAGGAAAYPNFMRRRFRAIGVPFLAWAALYAVLYVARAQDASAALAEVPGLVVSGHIWYHLYFVPMLLTFYLLTPVAASLIQRSPELALALAYILRVLLGPTIIHWAAGMHPLAGQYLTHVLSHLPHMALGAWFAVRLDVLPAWFKRGWPALLGVGIVVLGALSVSGLPAWPFQLQRLLFPSAMAMTVLGMALGAMALEPRYERWSRQTTHLGSLAFGVYFVHPLFLLGVFTLAGPAGPGSPWSAWWFTLLAWGVVSAASFALSEALRRGPATAWLVGLHAPRSTGR